MQVIKEKLFSLLDSIRKAPNQASLNDRPLLIGASKKQSIEKIILLAKKGLFHFGENYVQEWQRKYDEIQKINSETAKKIKWHFIGHLQSNKVKDIVGKVEYIHTIDSLKLAKKVSQVAQKLHIQQKVLCEINLAKESSKTGFFIEDFKKALPELTKLPGLKITGLMAIPPHQEKPEGSRTYFKQLKTLLDESKQSGLINKTFFKELSMGMSQDYLIALSEGATMIRIGTLLFGARSS